MGDDLGAEWRPWTTSSLVARSSHRVGTGAPVGTLLPDSLGLDTTSRIRLRRRRQSSAGARRLEQQSRCQRRRDRLSACRFPTFSSPPEPLSDRTSATAKRARLWRDARRMSSTVPRRAFVSARVRAVGAVVVTPSVRKRQRSTAALASTSWLLRSTSGDGVGSERVIAIVANHWPCIGAGMPAITRGVVRREGQDRPPCCCPAWKGALCSRPPDGRLRALASVRAANRRGRCGTSRSLSRGRPILQ